MVSSDAPAGSLRWVHEEDPRWDADRERVFAAIPEGVFVTATRRPGERLSSDWWRVERDGRVVGYGWLDDVWGDAEILLAVDGAEQRAGVGAFILEHLEDAAADRGLNYVLNVVRKTHPDAAAVTAWLERHGFTAADDGRLRRQVGDRRRDIGQHQAGRPGTGPASLPAPERQARYAAERERAAARPRSQEDAQPGEPMGPGREEGGGYVDVEQHRF